MAKVDGRGAPRSRAWRLYLLLGLVGVFGYSWLPSAPSHNLYYSALGTVAVAAIAVGVRLNRPSYPLPWYLVIVGQAMLVVGDGIRNYYEVVLRVESPFPSVADVAYLGGYAALVCGVALLLRTRTTAGADTGDALDAAIIAVGLVVVAWIYLMEPYAQDPSLPLTERLVSISYPLMDVLLIALAVRLLLSRGPRRPPAFYFVGASLVLTLVSDVVYAVLAVNDSYQLGNPVDAGWLASYVLWGAAALHPSMRNLSGPGPEHQPKLSRGRAASLVAAAVLAPMVFLLEHLRGNSGHELIVECSAVALFLLVLARMVGIVRRHERSVAREHALRAAGIKLVAAPGRDGVYAAALDAALGLVGEIPAARVGLALGSEEGMTVVVATGVDAAKIVGDPLNLDDLPASSRSRFLGKRPVDVEDGELAGLGGALGLATGTRPFFLVPLFFQDEIKGAIGVTSDAPVPAEIKDSLVSLASQVALALEGATLAEDLHRRQSEERFRALIQNSSDIITVVDAEGRIVYQSPSMLWVLGHDPEGRVGLEVSRSELVHPEDLPEQNGVLAEAVRNPGVRLKAEVRMRHRDGTWRFIESTYQSLPGNPNVGGTVINSRDVTERRKAEEALRESEARYRALVEQTPAITYIEAIDEGELEHDILYVSPQIEQLLGYSQHEWTTDPALFSELAHPEDRDWVLAEDARTEQTGEPFSVEYRNFTKDGRLVWLRDEAVLVRDDSGRPLYWQGVMYDVTEAKRAEEALRESERRLSTLLANAPAYVYRCRNEPGWPNEFVSDYALELTGHTPQELTGGKVLFGNLIVEEDRQRVWNGVQKGLAENRRFALEYAIRRRDGQIRHVEERSQGVYGEGGAVEAIEGVVYDVTERVRAEEALREAERRYRTLVEQIPAVTYVQEATGSEAMTYVSPQMEAMLGYAPEECVSDPHHWKKILHPDDRERVLAEDGRTNKTGEPFSMKYRQFARDGRVVWIRDAAALVRDEGGEPSYWLGVQTDVTERKQMEEKLAYRALHDPLTGLPNRDLLIDRLGRALASTRRSGCKVALLFMDLDNFKYVNDSLGHEAGDELLVEVAERLRASLRPGDTVARLGGDEFVVLLEYLESEIEAEAAAARLTESINRPFYLKGQEVFVTFSTGIALNAPDDAQDEDLLRDADVAMYTAKNDGKDRYRIFDASMNASARVRLELASDLRRALERDELSVHYQPTVSLESGRIVGFEALVRWQHPRKGLILPADFVPVAEETGLIIPMGRYTLREACCRSRG